MTHIQTIRYSCSSYKAEEVVVVTAASLKQKIFFIALGILLILSGVHSISYLYHHNEIKKQIHSSSTTDSPSIISVDEPVKGEPDIA